MRKLASLTFVVLAGLSVGALAGNLTITQKGRVFSSETVTIKKGEALTFANDDSVPHNIISTSKGNEFNEPGEALVICAIHPRMKLTVKITD
jgi:plastocyanin